MSVSSHGKNSLQFFIFLCEQNNLGPIHDVLIHTEQDFVS